MTPGFSSNICVKCNMQQIKQNPWLKHASKIKGITAAFESFVVLVLMWEFSVYKSPLITEKQKPECTVASTQQQ